MPRKLDILLANYLAPSDTPRKLDPLTGEKPDPSELLKDEGEDSSVLTVHGRVAVRTIHGRATIETIHGRFMLDLHSPQNVSRVGLSRGEDGEIVIELYE